jgi:hypothetical protein
VQEKALNWPLPWWRKTGKRWVGTLAPLDEKQAESQAAAARADLIQTAPCVGGRKCGEKPHHGQLWRLDQHRSSTSEKLFYAVPEVLSVQESWALFTKRRIITLAVGEKQGVG